ncbi:VOC family protein [Xanthobacter dioxanivorans]|uniref:VOC family protein n=1 Tax=Xanthobacter dioxanivorans TaxID=2528964 RepID=A0A974PUR9_9HYPH|nr:VOC family protein [Xanthobacter dioxanivorans]QRG09886.1 VOC family protein [Xanthobacter dioxanivorans]
MLAPLAFNHAGVTVPDIFAAIDWYGGVLGLTHIMGPRLLEAHSAATHETPSIFGPRFARAYQAHLLTANGTGIELFQFIEPPVADRDGEMAYWRPGPWHLCFTHPDVPFMAERIVAAGGRQRIAPTVFVPGRPWQLVYCEDPWGNVIEIISHSYAEIFANWPQPGMTEPPVFVARPADPHPAPHPEPA